MPTIRNLVGKLRNWFCPLKLFRGKEGRTLNRLIAKYRIETDLYDNVLWRLSKEMTFAQIKQIKSPSLRHYLESRRIEILSDEISYHLNGLHALYGGFGFAIGGLNKELLLHLFSDLPIMLNELDSIEKNRLPFDTQTVRKQLCKYFDWIRATRKDLFFTNK